MSIRSGSEHLVAELEEQGVRCVFGLPGTQTVPLFEALRRSRIRTVLATNELSAAFMAGGWARVTGEPGICLSIPGPGFTWSLTGLAEALLDSIPLLAIVGAPPDAPQDRRFRQQELAQGAIAAPLVKQLFEASRPEDTAAATRAALIAAGTGEPGPILLQVSSRAMREESDSTALPPEASGAKAIGAFTAILDRVRAARKPVLLAGQGVLHDAVRFRELVERLGAPVLTTPSARGVLPEDHPLSLGFDAVAGSVDAVNQLLDAADLIVVLGAKLGHNGSAGFALRLPADRLVRIDASSAVLEANYPASLTAAASVASALDALLQQPLAKSAWVTDEVAGWRTRIRISSVPPLEPSVAGSPTNDSAGFFAGLRRALPRQAILVLDSGLHQVMARRHFPVLEPGGLLFPSDLQSMGFGIPSAIGARLGAPNRPVVALVGDGAFTMTGFEILSAVREGLDLIVIVFVDGELGQIRLQQLADYGAAYAVHVGHPDLALMAASLGAGFADAGGSIETAVTQALEDGGVTIIEVTVGDTGAMRRTAAAARARQTVRRLLGPDLSRWLKRLVRRGD